ncbi:MAG: sensor histidine kinase [Catenulispora sp.]|nr:sensor histidine kinase [Catenulispora sp.]
MSLVRRPPLSTRLPPGAWTAAAWGVATASAFISWDAAHRYTIDVAPMPGLPNGFHRVVQTGGPPHEALLIIVTTVLTLTGSALLRRTPLSALGFLLAGAVIASANSSTLFEFLPVDVAVYLIAAQQTRRRAATALALSFGTAVGYSAVRLTIGSFTLFGVVLTPPVPTGGYSSADFVVALMTVVAWIVGTAARRGREYAAGLAAQAATAERLRLSRELHDSVAHTIGIIAVLAGAARRVIQTQPAEAREALRGIEATSRETLTGLQRMLRVLRDADPDTGADADAAREALPLAPASGLMDLERLAAQAAGAGVRVDVTWRGTRRPLAPEVELSAFRIIQEAVTNVVRHSGTDACRVDVGYEADGVEIEIVDDGAANGPGSADPAGGGFGLLGMRERVSLLSGQFSAGPRPEGGFRVAARLPA